MTAHEPDEYDRGETVLTDPGVTDPAMPWPGATADDIDRCTMCGTPIPPHRVLMGQTLEAVGSTRAPELLAAFYQRVFDVAPGVADMFPPDITDPTSDGAGRVQRDRLLNATVAVATSFNPRDPEAMRKLDATLLAVGEAHARFEIPDEAYPGGTRQLGLAEYEVVRACLLDTLEVFAGETWTPLHRRAWNDAVTYVSARMLAGQITHRPRHGRRG